VEALNKPIDYLLQTWEDDDEWWDGYVRIWKKSILYFLLILRRNKTREIDSGYVGYAALTSVCMKIVAGLLW
jgi:hypothetical protein